MDNVFRRALTTRSWAGKGKAVMVGAALAAVVFTGSGCSSGSDPSPSPSQSTSSSSAASEQVAYVERFVTVNSEAAAVANAVGSAGLDPQLTTLSAEILSQSQVSVDQGTAWLREQGQPWVAPTPAEVEVTSQQEAREALLAAVRAIQVVVDDSAAVAGTSMAEWVDIQRAACDYFEQVLQNPVTQ